MDEAERDRLMAEMAILQRLRGELPADHVLERSGFASRLQALEEQLVTAGFPTDKNRESE